MIRKGKNSSKEKSKKEGEKRVSLREGCREITKIE